MLTLEAGRDIVRALLMLLSVSVARWVDLTAGLWMLVVVALLVLQSSFTNWCPADLFLRPLGLKSVRPGRS